MEEQFLQPEIDGDYNLLMCTMGVSVSKHLVDEHFTVLWANDFYYDLIGYHCRGCDKCIGNRQEQI